MKHEAVENLLDRLNGETQAMLFKAMAADGAPSLDRPGVALTGLFGGAGLYLTALSGGERPFAADEDAYAFFCDPPSSPYHYCPEPGTDLGTRENLGQDGLLIRGFQL